MQHAALYVGGFIVLVGLGFLILSKPPTTADQKESDRTEGVTTEDVKYFGEAKTLDFLKNAFARQ